MKKIMIALATVACAFGVQAAAVDWSTGDLYGSNGEYISDNTYDGYTYSAILTITGGGLAEDIVSTGIMDWDGFAATAEGLALNTTYSASLVITEYKGGVALNTLSASGEFVTAASESFSKGITFEDGTGFTTGGSLAGASWQAVPEPTSGLLLLLGVAGLALRRKRA